MNKKQQKLLQNYAQTPPEVQQLIGAYSIAQFAQIEEQLLTSIHPSKSNTNEKSNQQT